MIYRNRGRIVLYRGPWRLAFERWNGNHIAIELWTPRHTFEFAR